MHIGILCFTIYRTLNYTQGRIEGKEFIIQDRQKFYNEQKREYKIKLFTFLRCFLIKRIKAFGKSKEDIPILIFLL